MVPKTHYEIAGLIEGFAYGTVSILKQLQAERKMAIEEVNQLNRAISVLEGLRNSGNRRRTHTMSAAGRARIAAAQRKRWAKVKAMKKK